MQQTFDHILIVMMENQYRNYVMTDPFMAKLAKAGMSLTNSFGCFHPSQTNYVASLAGELCQVSNDDAPTAALTQTTLVERMNAKGVTWRAYLEALPHQLWNSDWANDSYPAAEAPLAQAPNGLGQLARYFRKHNAFASFKDVQGSEDQWRKLGDENQFWNDVHNQTLPQYSWFSPDIWNDGHYLYNTHIDTQPRSRLVPQLANWLEYVFFGSISTSDLQGAGMAGEAQVGLNLDIDLLIQDPAAAWAQCTLPPRTLVVITFDEADYDAVGYDTNYDGPNQIYTVLLGDMIEPGSTWDAPVNHYSLMRTVQKNFGLEDLGKNDAEAGWLRSLWGQEFGWSGPQTAVPSKGGGFAVVSLFDTPSLIQSDAAGAGWVAQLSDGAWSEPTQMTLDAPLGAFKVARFGTGAMIVSQDEAGACTMFLTYDGYTWQGPTPVPAAQGWENLALIGFDKNGAQQTQPPDTAMLCGQGADGFIYYTKFDGTGWSTSAPVGQLSDGPMTLGKLGPSLFLVYKERNTNQMRATSYNLAEYNAITALDFEGNRAPDNDTTQNAWAIADFPVGHFAKKMAALKQEYRASGALSLASIEGEMHLVHRGAYSDTRQAYDTCFGLTGILTPGSAQSNGFGSLDQAGWTPEAEIPGVNLPDDGAHALCAVGDALYLLWSDPGDPSTFLWSSGAYRRSV